MDERAYAVVQQSLRAVHGKFEYVLIGGWAVYAHGSRVPSVDTDMLVRQRDLGDVARALGLSAGAPESAARCELFPLDRFNHILGQDVSMGERDLGYVASAVLEGRLATATLELPGGRREAIIPQAPELAFMKLKAFHDRELAWRAVREPAVMARIPPEQRPEVRERTEGYYLRKAGKDLYDIAFLCSHGCRMSDALALAEPFGLAAALTASWERRPRPLVRFAFDLAEDEATRRVLETR